MAFVVERLCHWPSRVCLHEIMDHVGWKKSRSALHYIKLKQVVNPAGVAPRLADMPLETGESYNLKGFLPAFSTE